MSSNRGEWEFGYTVGQVSDAAKTRAAWHRAREAHWTAQFDQIVQALPNALTVDRAQEFRAAQALTSNSYGRPQLQMPPKLASRYTEAVEKVGEHRRQAATYERWAGVLAASPGDRVLSLTMEDIEFFWMAERDALMAALEASEAHPADEEQDD